MQSIKAELGAPHLHLEIMRGSILENEIYCSKDGAYSHFGPAFLGKGARSDLQDYYQQVRLGKNDLELAEYSFSSFAHTLKATDRVRVAMKPQAPPQGRRVILYAGTTGGGKTRRAYLEFPNIYEMPVCDKLWLDGYQQEKEVLIDEFSGQLTLNNLLKLLDPFYVRKFEIKGGFTFFNPEIIVVTSNTPPSSWYKYGGREEQEAALRRRFHTIVWFAQNGTQTYNTPDQIKAWWPIPAADQPHRHVVAAPVISPLGLAPWARENGVLCSICNIYPCVCACVELSRRLEATTLVSVEAPVPLYYYCDECESDRDGCKCPINM